MKTVFFLILVFAISGLFTIGFSDVSATHDGKGESKSKGCENGSAAGKGNPHCGDNGEDPSPSQLTECDINPLDGIIDAVELSVHTGTSTIQATNIIADSSDGIIDTEHEVKRLNKALTDRVLLNCL